MKRRRLSLLPADGIVRAGTASLDMASLTGEAMPVDVEPGQSALLGSIVTNGRLWRLYSRQAHARATNFYEVDLVEALTASGDTDPNEAFRYWWLFFRPDAYRVQGESGRWLEETAERLVADVLGCGPLEPVH